MKPLQISSIIVPMLFLVLTVSLLSATASFAAETPITVEADRMASTKQSNAVTFTGDVDVRQGEFRIRADEMTVYYSPKKRDDNEEKIRQQVEKMVTEGNVEITQGTWIGTAEKAIYLAGKKQIHLIGEATASEGPNIVRGEEIVYYIDEQRSEILGGRPQVTIGEETPPKKKGRVSMTILQNKPLTE